MCSASWELSSSFKKWNKNTAYSRARLTPQILARVCFPKASQYPCPLSWEVRWCIWQDKNLTEHVRSPFSICVRISTFAGNVFECGRWALDFIPLPVTLMRWDQMQQNNQTIRKRTKVATPAGAWCWCVIDNMLSNQPMDPESVLAPKVTWHRWIICKTVASSKTYRRWGPHSQTALQNVLALLCKWKNWRCSKQNLAWVLSRSRVRLNTGAAWFLRPDAPPHLSPGRTEGH